LGSLNWNYVGKLIAYIIALDVELFDWPLSIEGIES
jgi:hypothetical protein